MAQAPSVSKPVRLPLVTLPENRGVTYKVDAKLVNTIVERRDSGDYTIMRRPGRVVYQTPGGIGLGIFNWNSSIFAAQGTTLFINGIAYAGVIDAANGFYRFTSCQGATPRLFMMNGSTAYTYDAVNGLVQVTDVNYPVSLVRGAAYLDGTIYVMDVKGNIYGSGINNPQSWNALNLIKAQIEPDAGIAITKHLTFVVAFKQWSTEFFYDAGNAAGSSLQANLPAKLEWGCTNEMTLQNIDGELIWLANNRSASMCIMHMVNGIATPISTKPIERLLSKWITTSLVSWTFKERGHRFYALTNQLETGSPTDGTYGVTLVYDIDEKVWCFWTESDGSHYGMVGSTYLGDSTHIMQHESNGALYLVSSNYSTDSSISIQVDIYTPNADLDTRRMKMLTVMEVIADVSGDLLYIRCSEDDYVTWSPFRTVSLLAPNPRLAKCGSFRRRAYHFQYLGASPLYLHAIECQIDIGIM